MQMPSRFETPSYNDKTFRKTRALLADLERRAELIGAAIAEEEQRTKIYDLAQPTYSILARNLRGRRDNLVATIAVLKRQIGAQRRTV
jgi:hypothetical protein